MRLRTALRVPRLEVRQDGQVRGHANERPSSNFKNKVSITAYACKERNGVVWTFMQEGVDPPDLPDFEWNTLPAENVYMSIRVESCNWMQALEGEIDSSHGPFLHSRIDGVVGSALSLAYQIEDKHPKFEILEMDQDWRSRHGATWTKRTITGESVNSDCRSTRCLHQPLGSDDQRPRLGAN